MTAAGQVPLSDRVAFSVPDAAAVAGVGERTLWRSIARGELPARKLGSRTLILRTELERFLEALPGLPRSFRTTSQHFLTAAGYRRM